MGFHSQIWCFHPRLKMLVQECTRLHKTVIQTVNITKQRARFVYTRVERSIDCTPVPFVVGLDMAKIAGLVAVDPLRASNT